MTVVFNRDRKRAILDRDAQRRRPCEDRNRDRSDTATKQGTPGAIRSWKRQGAFSSRAFRGSKALPIPQTLDSRVGREQISVVVSTQVSGTLLWQLKEINTALLCSFAREMGMHFSVWVPEGLQSIQERRQGTSQAAGSAPHRNSSFPRK